MNTTLQESRTAADLLALLRPVYDSGARLHWSNYATMRYRDRQEPIVHSGEGWRVTISQAGTLVLNSETLAMVDIDRLDATDLSAADRTHATFADYADLQQALLGFRRWLVPMATAACWRLYDTRKGWRLVRTDRPVRAAELPDYCSLMIDLPADRRYVELCEVQRCFRARLTPKPWRSPRMEAPVCRLVTTLGEDRVHPQLQSQLDLHDHLTRVAEQGEQLF